MYFGTKVLAHGLGAIAAHRPYALNLDIARRICRATEGHRRAWLKCRHHIRFWLAQMLRKTSRQLLKQFLNRRFSRGIYRGLNLDEGHVGLQGVGQEVIIAG